MNIYRKTTTVQPLARYINQLRRGNFNLFVPGDTVIKQAVAPGGDSALHLAELKLAIARTRVRNF